MTSEHKMQIRSPQRNHNAQQINTTKFTPRSKLFPQNQIRKWSEQSYKAIVVDGVDILLLRDHVAKAPTSGILEGNAGSPRTENPIDVVPVVELVIEALGNIDGLRRIAVLNDDQMVGLEERSPHLEEIEVSDGGDDDVEFIFEQGSGSGRHWRDRERRCGFEVRRPKGGEKRVLWRRSWGVRGA